MDGDLICNFKKCRKQICSFAWVTSCSHVFCDEDGSREFNKSVVCPACETTLSGKCDIVRSNVQPTEQWKSMVIAGQRPEVIMEICTRALSFWTYQVSTRIMGKFSLILVLFNISLILFYLVMYNRVQMDTRMNNLKLSQILDNQGSHQYDVMPTRDSYQDVQIGRRHINGVFENVNGSLYDFGQRSLKHDGTENPKTKTVINKNKFLVYLCNKQKLCGGWGVRQTGIISTFLLANLTNRIFKVSMTSPCKLQHFLIPNRLNWIPDIEELRGKTLSVINDVHNSTFLDILRWKNFNMYYSHDIVFVRATMDFTGILTQNPVYIKQVSKMTTQAQSATFKHNWNLLMAPSMQTQTVLHNILALNNRSVTRYEDLVCAHVKLGSDHPTENVQNILQILQQWTRMNPKIFIATDSDDFRSISRSSFRDNILDSGGTVLNIDTERGTIDSCLGLRTVILDQMILSRCKMLALSHGDFGRNTAFLRGTNKRLEAKWFQEVDRHTNRTRHISTIYQGEMKAHQEIIYQEYQATKHREKSSQLQQYYEQIVSKTQTELTIAKKDLDGMKKKHGELAERLSERSRQYQKLQSLYESLRRRCITPASFNGGGDASMIDQTANRLQNFTMNLTTGDVLRGQNSSNQGSRGQSPPERDFVFRPNNTPLLAEQSRFTLMLGTPK